MEVKQQYRNMKQVIDRHPEIVDYAIEAIRRAGLTPVQTARSAAAPTARGCRSWACPAPTSSPASTPSIRGWNGSAVQDMEKAVQTIVHLAMIWEERA